MSRSGLVWLVGLVLAGCGRLGFGERSADSDAASGDVSGDGAGSPQVSTTPYSGETSISVAATPEGYTVVSALRAGGPLTVQRFSNAWEPSDATAIQLAQQTDLVAIGYGTKQVVVAEDVGMTTSTVGTLDASASPTFTPTTTMAAPPNEPALSAFDGALASMSPVAGGYEWWAVALDGSSALNRGGAGSGTTSQVCAGGCSGTWGSSLCSKIAGGFCTTGRAQAGGGNGGSGFSGDCRNPSLVMIGTLAYAVFDANPGIRIVQWDASVSAMLTVQQTILPTGDHAKITADNRGLVVAYRDGAAVMTAIFDPTTLAMVAAPAPVAGIPAALGMFVLPQGSSTMLIVAAADGMYRIRI